MYVCGINLPCLYNFSLCQVFTSLEPKAHVYVILTEIFPLPIVVVIVVVAVVLNYSHFLVQNHRANFNNTWQKASIVKGGSNESPRLLQREILSKKRKHIDEI